MAETKSIAPQRPIRRFDVFAEYRKQEEEARGRPEGEAMGYGLWVAKVVAARRFGGATAKGGQTGDDGRHGKHDAQAPEHLVDGMWHTLGDEPQTDALFQKEVIDRMGQTFYHRVFVPAIEKARADGTSYEEIRDTIRTSWKPS